MSDAPNPRRARRKFTAEQKAAAVRRHLADKIPISDLADELDVQPSQIHQWVHQVLEQAERAFERSGPSSRDDGKIAGWPRQLVVGGPEAQEVVRKRWILGVSGDFKRPLVPAYRDTDNQLSVPPCGTPTTSCRCHPA